MTTKTRFGRELLQAMSEAWAHIEGKEVPGAIVHPVAIDEIDAKAVRQRLKLTQDQMARFLGTSSSGYKKWEQGQRQPGGAARTLLRVMDREPEAVLRALSDA